MFAMSSLFAKELRLMLPEWQNLILACPHVTRLEPLNPHPLYP